MTVLGPHPAPKKNWNDLLVLSTLSIWPSNSRGKSLKPQSLFSISAFLSKTIIWQPVFTINPQICTATYCTHLPIHLTSKTQFRTPNFSGSIDSAAMIQTSTPNVMKCLISFPNAAILRTSFRSKALNHVQNINRESALEPPTSNNEERIPFTLTFHPNNSAARNMVLRNFKIYIPNPPLISSKPAKLTCQKFTSL